MARGITRYLGSSRLAKELAVSHGTVVSRMRAGMSLEEAREDLLRRAELVAAGVPARGPAVGGTAAMAGGVGPHAPLNPNGGKAGRFAKPDSRHPRSEAKGGASVVGAPGRGNAKNNGDGNGHRSLDPALEVSESMFQAQLRKERALADQQEMKARQMAGELIEAAAIERWYANVIVKARDLLMRIGPESGDRLAVETRPSECAQIVEAKVREVLGMLAAGVYRS